MMLKRYSIQWRGAVDGWHYWHNKKFWTRRGAAKKALSLVTHRRSLCTFRVMKNIKGSDYEVLFLHRTSTTPWCNCPAAGNDSQRTRKRFPK